MLSGGAGTRLWPLSTAERPKQYLDLVGDPLIARALHRLDDVPGCANPIVVTGVEHIPLLRSALEAAGIASPRVIVEPAGRNTAAAVIAAALVLDPDEIMVVLPADQMIQDGRAFTDHVSAAVGLAAGGALVTFGVVPRRAETGYGYITKGAEVEGGYEVERFTEKPEESLAAAMVADGRHLWNSGIFMFGVGSFLDEARRLAPDLVDQVAGSLPVALGPIVELEHSFAQVEEVSVDNAIMERTSIGVVVPIDVGWTDLGSWQSLWEASTKDADGNAVNGDVVFSDVTGSLLRSTSRRVAVAGVENVVVVETPDAVLVLGLDRAQDVRRFAESASQDATGD